MFSAQEEISNTEIKFLAYSEGCSDYIEFKRQLLNLVGAFYNYKLASMSLEVGHQFLKWAPE